MNATLQVGSLLAGVFTAEEGADHALRFPSIRTYAESVISLAQGLERPILVPVGADGLRLLGAVELLCEGELEQAGWHTSVSGRNVLLVGVAGVSGAEISAAAFSARRLGAHGVHACAVDAVLGDGQAVDSFTQLSAGVSTSRRRRTA